MTMQEIEARRAEIAVEIEAEGADLDALETEVRTLVEAEKEIRAQAAEDAEKRAAIAQGLEKVEVIEERKQEEKTMTMKEVRSSNEYLDAYVEYMKTGEDSECRALLTELAGEKGVLPVPVYIAEKVGTAWSENKLLSLTTKTHIKGIVKVGVEVSGTDAIVPDEGGDPIDEEELSLVIQQLVPVPVKKWISISDEALGLTGAAFADYIVDELVYRINKKIEDEICGIWQYATTGTYPVPFGTVETSALSKGDIIQMIAKLSDEAGEPVLVMNKATWGEFASLTTQDGYPIPDVFSGIEVIWNNTFPAFDTAANNSIVAALVDPKAIQVNYPEGDEVQIKFDDKTLMTQDLVRILGRTMVAYEMIAPNAFVQLKKVAG